MEFSKEIITVLDYLCNKFGIAIDWTSENVIPYLEDLCRRYIQYEVFTSIAWMVAIPAITFIIAIPLAIAHRKAKGLDWDFDYNFAPWLAGILWTIFGVMAFASICVICTQVFDIIECYTLPEKVILEYLKTLMNTASN
jgi:hypothetical protein